MRECTSGGNGSRVKLLQNVAQAFKTYVGNLIPRTAVRRSCKPDAKTSRNKHCMFGDAIPPILHKRNLALGTPISSPRLFSGMQR